MVRAERRRRAREHTAQTMHELTDAPALPIEGDALRPVIDDALAGLSDRDREAVLLRYFEGRLYPEIGAKLSLSADAARLRVERALDKMRVSLLRRGVASTVAALAAVCSSQAAVTVPAELACSITSASLAGITAGAGKMTLFASINTAKAQLFALSALLLAGGFELWWQQQIGAELQDELTRTSQDSGRIAGPRVGELAPEPDGTGKTELQAVRREADAVKRRLDDAHSEVALSPGLIPTCMWQNVGQATPGDAYETLHWALDVVEVRTLGHLIVLAPAERTAAIAMFERLPAAYRAQLGITTPEEMIGLACAMRETLSGAEVNGAEVKSDDEISVNSLEQRLSNVEFGPGGSGSRHRFRRNGKQWQWVITPWLLEAAQRELAREFSAP